MCHVTDACMLYAAFTAASNPAIPLCWLLAHPACPPSLHTKDPQTHPNDTATLPAAGIIHGGLPQLPLTALNSVVAVCQLSGDLFPGREARPAFVAASVGLMNLVGPWLGALPVCHGAGGLAAQVCPFCPSAMGAKLSLPAQTGVPVYIASTCTHPAGTCSVST